MARETERRDWGAVAATALADVRMLRTELIVGYLIAGFAAALDTAGLACGRAARGRLGSAASVTFCCCALVC